MSKTSIFITQSSWTVLVNAHSKCDILSPIRDETSAATVTSFVRISDYNRVFGVTWHFACRVVDRLLVTHCWRRVIYLQIWNQWGRDFRWKTRMSQFYLSLRLLSTECLDCIGFLIHDVWGVGLCPVFLILELLWNFPCYLLRITGASRACYRQRFFRAKFTYDFFLIVLYEVSVEMPNQLVVTYATAN